MVSILPIKKPPHHPKIDLSYSITQHLSPPYPILREAIPPSAPKILLPLPRILNPVAYVLRAALDPVPQRLHRIAERLARIPRHAGDGLSHAATRSAHDPACGFGDPAHAVADGGGHEGDWVMVFVVVEWHGCWFCGTLRMVFGV